MLLVPQPFWVKARGSDDPVLAQEAASNAKGVALPDKHPSLS